MCWRRPGGGTAGDICVLQRLFRGRAVISIRTDSEVLLYFDIRAILADGVPMYVSPNNVVLIEGFNRSLPNKYTNTSNQNKRTTTALNRWCRSNTARRPIIQALINIDIPLPTRAQDTTL